MVMKRAKYAKNPVKIGGDQVNELSIRSLKREVRPDYRSDGGMRLFRWIQWGVTDFYFELFYWPHVVTKFS